MFRGLDQVHILLVVRASPARTAFTWQYYIVLTINYPIYHVWTRTYEIKFGAHVEIWILPEYVGYERAVSYQDLCLQRWCCISCQRSSVCMTTWNYTRIQIGRILQEFHRYTATMKWVLVLSHYLVPEKAQVRVDSHLLDVSMQLERLFWLRDSWYPVNCSHPLQWFHRGIRISPEWIDFTQMFIGYWMSLGYSITWVFQLFSCLDNCNKFWYTACIQECNFLSSWTPQ